MLDSPTLKAFASTIVTFAIIIAVGTFTSAVGQDTAPRSAAPAADPYENVAPETNVAAHNRLGQPVPDAAHNIP